MTFPTLDPKDPDSLNVDYLFDFAPIRNGRVGHKTEYLKPGEIISEIVNVTADDPQLTIESFNLRDDSSSVEVITSNGTNGIWVNVTARIKTNSVPPKTDDRTFRIFITQR